jgi:hypothetical protein
MGHGTQTYSFIRRFLNCKISNNLRIDWIIFETELYSLLKFRAPPSGLQLDYILAFTEGENAI